MTRTSEHFGDKFPTGTPNYSQLLDTEASARYLTY